MPKAHKRQARGDYMACVLPSIVVGLNPTTLEGGRMNRILKLLLAPLTWLFDGAMTSGAESCDYLRRLNAVPLADAREQRRAA
jgi:hypothetical protein